MPPPLSKPFSPIPKDQALPYTPTDCILILTTGSIHTVQEQCPTTQKPCKTPDAYSPKIGDDETNKLVISNKKICTALWTSCALSLTTPQ